MAPYQGTPLGTGLFLMFFYVAIFQAKSQTSYDGHSYKKYFGSPEHTLLLYCDESSTDFFVSLNQFHSRNSMLN